MNEEQLGGTVDGGGGGGGGGGAGSSRGSLLQNSTAFSSTGSISGGRGESGFPAVVELNVGGVIYATTLATLTRDAGSLLGQLFASAASAAGGQQPPVKAAAVGGGLVRDNKGRYFIDRDGVLFRYVLDYLRNGCLVLPECFHELDRLRHEADYFRLPDLTARLLRLRGSSTDDKIELTSGDGASSTAAATRTQSLSGFSTSNGGGASSTSLSSQQQQLLPVLHRSASFTPTGKDPGYVIVGYRGTFQFGRDGGQADVKFRKLWRILVSGRVALCREVFRDALNESRDVDRGTADRYSARFFLKHTFIEQAFDALLEADFRLVAACGSGTNSAGELKPGMDTEESKWNHYNEFVFCRY